MNELIPPFCIFYNFTSLFRRDDAEADLPRPQMLEDVEWSVVAPDSQFRNRRKNTDYLIKNAFECTISWGGEWSIE